MPFNTTASVISTDLDNMLRGLFRDNSDTALTGSIIETNLKSVSISANTIGPTGGLFVKAVGSAIGAGGTKSVKLWFGSTVVMAFTVPSGSQCWFIKAWIYNTATNAQRIYVEAGSIPAAVGIAAAPVLTYEYETISENTATNITLKTTVALGNAADTFTHSMWDGYVVQIT